MQLISFDVIEMWLLIALFIVLQPGLFVTFPPVGKKLFGSGKSNLTSILVHAVIFVLVAQWFQVGVTEGFQAVSCPAGQYADTGGAAQFYSPYGVAVDSTGNVYVADSGNQRIRKVTPGGVVITLAGWGTLGFADGTGAAAQFNNPNGVAVDSTGNVYIGDTGNQRIRKVTPGGVVSTLAGSGVMGFADGTGAAAKFNYPKGVAVDSTGNVYVADSGNQRIRKVTPGGVVSTLAGSGTLGFADSLVCMPCPAGYSCSGGNKTPCPAGTYSAAGQTTCTTDDPGYWSGSTSGSETLCPAGYSCSGGMKTPCPAGTYSPAGKTTCTTDGSGYWSGSMAGAQTICPAGYSCSDSTMPPTICPVNYYSPAGATQCIKCAAGYRSAAGAGACTQQSLVTITRAGTKVPIQNNRQVTVGETVTCAGLIAGTSIRAAIKTISYASSNSVITQATLFLNSMTASAFGYDSTTCT